MPLDQCCQSLASGLFSFLVMRRPWMRWLNFYHLVRYQGFWVGPPTDPLKKKKLNFSLEENSVSSIQVTWSKTFVWFVHVLPSSALILQVVPLLPTVWRHSWGNFRTFISMNPGWVSVCLNISWHRTLKCGISTGRIWIVFVFLGCLTPRTKSGPGGLRAFTDTLDNGCVVRKTVDSDGSVVHRWRSVGLEVLLIGQTY